MGDQSSLSRPLLFAPRSSPSGGGGIVFRLLFLSLVAALALWASHEASRGFRVSIVNALPPESRAGKRFDLFYVSDDKATRVLLAASDFVEDLLYGGGGGYEITPGKPVRHVALRLVGEDFPGGVSVRSVDGREGFFVVDLSHKVLEESDVDLAVKSAVLRGMAHMWLWDNGAPREVVSGMVEYIAMAGGSGRRDLETVIRCGHGHSNRSHWFVDKDPILVARLLGRCEEMERGFIQRLNRGMRDGWHDRTVEDALGKPAQLCLCVPDT